MEMAYLYEPEEHTFSICENHKEHDYGMLYIHSI